MTLGLVLAQTHRRGDVAERGAAPRRRPTSCHRRRSYSSPQTVSPYSLASSLVFLNVFSELTRAAGSSSPFSIDSSADSITASAPSPSSPGIPSALISSISWLTLGRRIVSASSSSWALLGSSPSFRPDSFAKASNSVWSRLFPAVQIALPFLTNSAFVIDAVVELPPPPQPVAIMAITTRRAVATAACFTCTPPVVRLMGGKLAAPSPVGGDPTERSADRR